MCSDQKALILYVKNLPPPGLEALQTVRWRCSTVPPRHLPLAPRDEVWGGRRGVWTHSPVALGGWGGAVRALCARLVAQTPPDHPRVMAASQVFCGGRGRGTVFGQARSRASRARCQRNYGHVDCATPLCCCPSGTAFFSCFGEMSGGTASLARTVRGLRLQRHDSCCAAEP